MPKVYGLIPTKLFKRRMKSEETAKTTFWADNWLPVPAVVEFEDADTLEYLHKAPTHQNVTVTKLVSGFAPEQCRPILFHPHNQGGVSSMSKGDNAYKQEEATETTTSDSFSLSSFDSSSDDGTCALRFTEPDCYGQTHPIETPQLIASKLQSFEHQLVAIPHHKKTCLKQAMKKCPELLTDKFKLMFLRCECFNDQKAAKRYAKYWDNRVEVFGPEKAFQPLTLDKALCDDGLALSTGFPTLSPTKHPSGRNILFADATTQMIGAYPTQSMVRAIWYMFHAALEDEETQKKGLVFLGDTRTVKLSLFDKDLARVTAFSVAGCIPVRLSSLHGFCPPRIFLIIVPVLKIFLGERLRKRIYLHGGSDMEKVCAGMAKFGLVETVLPRNVDGKVLLSHESWLQERRLAGL
ncbi:tocopherol transfer protein-like [Seminavis robusta]|uniref:Tocopherol transfer protein-like n=1 Tax=Seminavis robusta TaxID=568900 RepID=A0A9N8HLZ6_9STRA|nr:tocopherol transfer protein-like [Seminavis robusta]|eukprot:Sro957_g224560.1 tocopherol transfer protein-like (408) ;mRNA; r:30256-31479